VLVGITASETVSLNVVRPAWHNVSHEGEVKPGIFMKSVHFEVEREMRFHSIFWIRFSRTHQAQSLGGGGKGGGCVAIFQ
jgi:hypothetical protein